MEPKQSFFTKILNHYSELSNGRVPKGLLVEVSSRIADYYYDQYGRFCVNYPKSIKRYSSFSTKDLDHPETFELVINFFKSEIGNEYPAYSKILLKMDDNELKLFEKNREDYHNR